MSIDLLKVLTEFARLRGTTVEHEVAKHNVGVVEARRWIDPLKRMSASEEERVARAKASRARSVVKAREKRQAARAISKKRAGSSTISGRGETNVPMRRLPARC